MLNWLKFNWPFLELTWSFSEQITDIQIENLQPLPVVNSQTKNGQIYAARQSNQEYKCILCGFEDDSKSTNY